MRGEEPVTNASPHLLLPSSGHTAEHSVESHPHGFWVPIANQGMEHSPSQKPAHTSSVPHDSRHSAEMTGSKEKVNTTSVSTKFKYLDSQQKDKKKMRCKTESLASPNLSSASAMTAWRPLTHGHQTPHSHSLQFQGRKKKTWTLISTEHPIQKKLRDLSFTLNETVCPSSLQEKLPTMF